MWFFKSKKQKKEKQEVVVSVKHEGASSFHEEEYRNALRLYDEAHADEQYQKDLHLFCDLVSAIRESYSVNNALGSFSGESGDKLIDLCADAINLDIELKEKRDYYDNQKHDMSEPAKTLAMVFEKRGEYGNAAAVCVMAIENGFPADGTSGGMRGRLARMIKKGNLPLTDDLKRILNL